MSTLRERQRERRRRDIMDAAAQLFGGKGLEATSMEEVAAHAEVGTATVYKYFGSKDELLHALFLRYLEQEAEEGEAALQRPPEDMAEGMYGLLESYLDGMARRCAPKLLQEFYALSMSKRLGYGRGTLELKGRFLDQCRRLAEYYKQRGKVRDGVTADETAAMCYSAAMLPFSLFSLGLTTDVEEASRLLRRYVTLALTGIGRPLTSDDEAGRRA